MKTVQWLNWLILECFISTLAKETANLGVLAEEQEALLLLASFSGPEFPACFRLKQKWRLHRVSGSKDTADDAAQGPESDAEAQQVDGPAVDVGLHVVGEHRLKQDVKSPKPKGENRPHEVHVENGGLLLKQTQRYTDNTIDASEPEHVDNDSRPAAARTWKLATTHIPKELVQPTQSPMQFNLRSLRSSTPNRVSTCL